MNPKRKNDGYHRWSRAIRGRLPKLADYAVARALADYSNADGTACRPGLVRLAADLTTSTKTVQRSVDYLDEHGWITLVNPGVRRRGEANEYTLSIPAPLAVEMGLWPGPGEQWMERPPDIAKHLGGHRRPPKARLGGHPVALGGQSEVVTVDTGVHPPGTTHHPSSHHSDSLTRPRAEARGGETMIDEEDPDVGYEITAKAEELSGGMLSPLTYSLIDSMLAAGAHPKMVLNAAVARERDPAWGA